MARYDDLVAEHERDTDRKAAAFVAEAGALLDGWRRDLVVLLSDRGITSADKLGAPALAAVLPAVEALADTYRGRFDDLLARASRALAAVEVEHLAELLAEFEPAIGPDLLVALRQLPDVAVTEARRMGLLLVSRRLWGSARDEAQAGLLAGMQAGESGARATRRVTTIESQARIVARARMVAEMEARRTASEVVTRAIEDVERTLVTAPGYRADPILRRIVEILDKRNHPFSRVADGTTARVGQPFRVGVIAVATVAAAMRKSGGGVFWTVSGSDYVGDHLPAHYGDRGRVTLDRASWHPNARRAAP